MEHSTSQPKEKKAVPRFRRKNATAALIDADDAEAQALIDKDLQSHFVWTSDTITDDWQHRFGEDTANGHQQEQQQHISLNDQGNEQFIYGLEHNPDEEFWKGNLQGTEWKPTQWTDDHSQRQIHFSSQTIDNQAQQWTLDEHHRAIVQLNLDDDQPLREQFDTNDRSAQQQTFIEGEQFRNQMTFAIESSEEQVHLFPDNDENLRSTTIDSQLPSSAQHLSAEQAPIVLHWIEGQAEYTLSLPVDHSSMKKDYSPSHGTSMQLDSNQLKTLRWSLDLLKENLILSYLISLPNQHSDQLSLPDTFQLQLSLDDPHNAQAFSITDTAFEQTLSLSSDDIKRQLLSLIDSIEFRQHFGADLPTLHRQFSLKDVQALVQNLSPDEILHLLYSPDDAHPITLEQLLIESDEISARAFRRYRCKHMSIKSDDKDQLDSTDDVHLQFHGNESMAIGEAEIRNDLDEEQTFRDVTNCEILLSEEPPHAFDIIASERPRVDVGPCLLRSDYEREPPKTWSRLRREVGYVSYDASLAHPTYHLDKSFKRYVHIPKKRTDCSYNVYRGYREFLDHAKVNPDNYFRPHDGTDLRPFLHWYSHKQYLFSATNKAMLKPPTFICRRLVLRTLLANLYCDSDPWKLLVVRIKGQFYLAMANKATRHVEDMTEDEYSGYKFEDLFTTEQPNTTRFGERTPLDHPQRQFHTVQYWKFGEFNLLYSNEIDGDINEAMIPKRETNDNSVQITLNESTAESKSSEMEDDDVPDDETKVAQINENLALNKSDEHEEPEKKKRFDNEIKSGYVEMKCTNKKIFYRDENKLQTLHWWAQMWLANINTLMIGYKSSNDGTIEQLDFFSMNKLVWKFLSRYDLHLKYCLSYLHSFLQLIQRTVHLDDPNTIHAFAYIPQPLELDPLTGKPIDVDLPHCVPFRYTQMKRSNQRHANLLPEWYLQQTQRTQGLADETPTKTVEQELTKRVGHRGRASCVLKQQQQQTVPGRFRRKKK